MVSEPPARDGRPTLAITMGDPGGIGPEVIVKALATGDFSDRARMWIMGPASALHRAADRAEIDPFWWRIEHGSDLLDTVLAHDVVVLDYDSELADPGLGFAQHASRHSGALSFKCVEDAVALSRRSSEDACRVNAIVTGPICKQAWEMAGRGKYAGHTELLATRYNAKRCAMLFSSPRLRVVLATVHIPLMEIRNALTIGRVFDAIDLGNDACRQLGVETPRIGVCGLNPHAGEAGLLGDEEERIITPAIEAARHAGISARGPYPADTIFNAAVRGEFDLVVAMYHDQGLIPIKLLAWDSAVNVTLGLPVVRTSPDHGTAFDIAGRGIAEASSMKASIDLAIRLLQAPQRTEG